VTAHPEPRLPTAEPSSGRETKAFWEALNEGRFVLPRCDRCREVIWYPRQFCPFCHTMGVSWSDASGRGTIYSFTVVRQAFGEWKGSVPYVIAYVELLEGPRVLTNVVECDPETIAIGDEVELTLDRSEQGAALYRFKPVIGPNPSSTR
jgi:uncharacterized OB-fold protein